MAVVERIQTHTTQTHVSDCDERLSSIFRCAPRNSLGFAFFFLFFSNNQILFLSPSPSPGRRAKQVRWSGGNFVCLVADDGGDGSEMVGACDLTLLPAGGPKKSREGLVADVPSQLALDDDAHFLYLTAGRRRLIIITRE